MKKIRVKSKKNIFFLLLSIVLIFILYTIWGNKTIQVDRYNVESTRISKNLSGYKIAQISDLHNAEFGKNESQLLDKLKNTSPDIIVITGDLIDSSHTDIDVAMEFVEGAVKIAPVYYVTGNHEAWSGRYEELKARLEDSEVTILENSCQKITYKNSVINLVGIMDPAFLDESAYVSEEESMKNTIESISYDKNNFTILLSHRPEVFSLYEEEKIDLIFSGHAHGGQFRIPFLGGLIAPDQGIFPEYTSGAYTSEWDDQENKQADQGSGTTTMIVSRGLGNSIIPVRINNRPALVLVTLSEK